MLADPQANASIPNELEWISNFLSFERILTGSDIESVRNFSLLWNLFEGLICNKNASVITLENAVLDLQKRKKINIDYYEQFLEYFVERYAKNGETNRLFDELNLRRNDKPELVKAVLKGNETSSEKVLLAILIIVFRYRNNLFHGEKSIYKLQNQIDNFRNANQFLMLFMEKWKE
jgi:hypothetical protein